MTSMSFTIRQASLADAEQIAGDSTHDHDSRGRVQTARVRFAVHSLAIVAMADVLHHWFARNFNLHRATGTFD
jgi:hypothetical protein